MLSLAYVSLEFFAAAVSLSISFGRTFLDRGRTISAALGNNYILHVHVRTLLLAPLQKKSCDVLSFDPSALALYVHCVDLSVRFSVCPRFSFSLSLSLLLYRWQQLCTINLNMYTKAGL